MKIGAVLVLAVAGLCLAGCSEVEIESEDEMRFTIVSHSGVSDPILLDQANGRTWRLTEEGWQPIPALDRKGRTVDWEDLDD